MRHGSIKLISILALWPIFTCFGQDMDLYHKVKEDQLLVRWMPQSIDGWKSGIENGYQVQVTSSGNKVVFDTIVRNTLSQNQDDSELLNSLFGIAYHDSLLQAYNAAYPDSASTSTFSDSTLFEAFILLSSRNRTALETSGMMVSLPIVSNENYTINVKANIQNAGIGETLSIVSNQTEEPDVPILNSRWENKRVNLSWSTAQVKKDYFFYNLYFSDNGESWQKIDSLYLNLYDESDPIDLQNINPTKDLPANDTLYWFKIHGIDFLGEESEKFSVTKGTGSKGIQVSPYFESVEQLRTNEALLRWNIPDESRAKVQSFTIYVAENYEGPYFPDTIDLDPESKEAIRPIPFRSAYFRIAAVDRNKEEFSSFPQLVMGVDTMAPAIPSALRYTIDSLGILEIEWNSNDEDDFIGYKLFYGYDTTIDMTLAHEGYLTTPLFRDTIELKTLNREVFYKATAVDARNNRSNFSTILTVEKPDILPPVEPVFLSTESGPGQIQLKWYASISDDVKEQRLFRRSQTSSDWELLELWNQPVDTIYTDKVDDTEIRYAYTLTVIDSAGNESPPAIPVMAFALPDHRSFDYEDWDLEVVNGIVEISHNFDPAKVDKVSIYRKEDGGAMHQITRLAATALLFADRSVKKDVQYAYAVKVMLIDGVESPLSNFKEVRI